MSRKTFVVLLLMAGACLFGTLCTLPSQEKDITNLYGQVFAGSAACEACHHGICSGFIHTPHYLDSRPANAQTIKGSFEQGKDTVIYDSSLSVIMLQRDNQFTQAAYRNGRRYRSESIDLVIGSGRKGQSYLYWKDERLFQLPVSYFTPLGVWCESPGYSMDTPYFDRQVPAECLECHTTSARTVFRTNRDYGDRFDKSRIIYGVTCERCHGPAAQHVAFHTQHPKEMQGRFILNAGRMSRRRQLDACGICHSGSRIPLKPAFSFRTGDSLNEFSGPKFEPGNASTLDVHGNQYGLLTASKCFQASELVCSTCHNVHENNQGGLKAFSQKCMSCHPEVRHSQSTAASKIVFADNCIDCHMPALPSKRIVMRLSGKADTSVANLVRTHRIAIYNR